MKQYIDVRQNKLADYVAIRLAGELMGDVERL